MGQGECCHPIDGPQLVDTKDDPGVSGRKLWWGINASENHTTSTEKHVWWQQQVVSYALEWRLRWCDFRGDGIDSPPKFPTGDAWVVFGDNKLWLRVGMEVEVVWRCSR